MSERRQQRRPGPGGRHGMMISGQKAKNFKGTFRRLLGYLRPHRTTIIIVFITAILSALFAVVSPRVMGLATTELFEGFISKQNGGPGIDFQYIGIIVLILIGLYVFSSLFSFLMNFLMVNVTQKTVYSLRDEVNEKLEKLPLKYYDTNAHGDILSRVTNDIDTVANTLQQSVVQVITAVITIIGVIIMMFSISWIMTLVVLFTLPISMIFVRMITKRSQKYFKKQQKVLGELNGHVEEMITAHKVVKLFNYEKTSLNKFKNSNDGLYDSGWKAQFVSGIIMPTLNFVSNVGYVIVSVVGSVLVLGGNLSVGNVQAFIQYSQQFNRPIMQTANIANIIQAAIAAAERVFEVLDEMEMVIENPDTLAIESGKVSFNNVDFGYEKDKKIIENLNVEVNPGETVAIVGPTGAGKTTLVNLLLRFYELDNGNIEIDGKDITDVARGSLRDNFGMVLQDTWLFNGSIKENIKYGRLDATDEEIYEAAKAARADHFIRTLPDGYDTVLNEEANNISQGQKQLLTIARAILKDPKVLILDEATSSVDTKTEVDIQRAMEELMKNRTNFVIAHRLSTIKGANNILVMNDGKIIEQGSHNELIEKQGFYADLYQSQFAN